MKLGVVALALSGVSLVAGCARESVDGVEQLAFESQEIVNGQLDVGHPATVALVVDGFPFCSGTLVTPTVVVTAAHCITEEIGAPAWQDVDVFFGSSVFEPGVVISVVDAERHPNFDVSGQAPDNDIAVLRLQSAAPVSPVAMAQLPGLGTTLTMVGFGITQANGQDSGTKRVAQASIADQQGSIFVMEITPSGTCNGDSGGTALWNDGGVEKLVGIHTRSDCETVMLDEIVGAHIADFVQPFIDAGGITCAADGACASGCTMPDPDCPCAGDGFCTSACPDVATDPDCDPQCAGGGSCVEGCPVPDPDCPVCIADGACNETCASDPDCSAGEGGAGSGGSDAGGAGADDGEADGCDCATSSQRPAGRRFGSLIAALALGLRRRRARTK